MKIEEVIKQLESIADHTERMLGDPDADEIWEKDIEALKFAITALCSMPEAGEPIDSPPAHIDRSKWEECELCSLPDGKSASRLILAETCNGEAKYCPRCGRPLTKEAWAELERRLRG